MSLQSSSRDYWGVVKPVGLVSGLLGVAATACALIGALLDWGSPRPDLPQGGESGLFATSAVGLLVGAYLRHLHSRYLRQHQGHTPPVTRRQATLAVSLIWMWSCVVGAIPFAASTPHSFVDGLFESMSGLTTTGSTIVTNIEGTLPRSILLWRSLLQWLGGMGIVVLFVAVFPNVGIGGKHMIRGEVPGTRSEGLTPRIAETSFALWKIYAALTLLEVVLLVILGVGPFEAVCHAFTTMSTGGFSTRDASIAAFDSVAIELVVATFMFVAAMNYALFFAALRGRTLKVFYKSTELRWFVGVSAVSVLLLTLGTLELHHRSLFQSFRYAYFTVATTISSTGYVTDDYMAYPPAMLLLILTLMFIGGCSGSTAGGYKVERMVLIGKQTWHQIKKFFRPNLVQVVRMGRTAVPHGVLADVAAMMVVYAVCLTGGVFILCTLEGSSVDTAFGAILTCLSNIGPAPFYEIADNFAGYSDVSKMVCVLAMLLGRLEFFTVLALLVPAFWRR